MADNKPSKNLWGNAHSKKVAEDVILFTASRDTAHTLPADQKLIPFDIKTNLAHSKMLAKIGVLTAREYKEIGEVLEELEVEYEKGNFNIDDEFEDIHSQIEYEVTKRVGEAGKKLHTGRSRNDQVTTDMFLYLKETSQELIEQLESFLDELKKQVDNHQDTICPGFTHYQKAMVTTYGSVMESFLVGFERDKERILATMNRFDFSPLGSGAGYGSLLPIDSGLTAKELGFKSTYQNSIDVISSRGEFEANLCSDFSILLNRVSILAQTLIVFSLKEFNYVKIADEFTTGSSIMPQKKNPDVLEVIKSKASYIQGQLTALLSVSRGAMIGYNRDTQQTKYIIMDAMDSTLPIMPILEALISSLVLNKQNMEDACSKDFITSAGLMEIIISEKELPMREAKQLVERSIKNSLELGSKDLISYKALNQAIKEMNLSLDINEDELSQWQDPKFQIRRLP